MLEGSQPFAVFLYNFTDSPVPRPFDAAAVRDAWHTVTTYWSYNSFGILSVGESTVFDWQTVPMTNADFTASFTGTDASGNPNGGRYAMVEYIKTLSGIDTSPFRGFIVIFCQTVGDAYSAGNDAVFEPSIVHTTLLCHEMQHMFGEPDHAYDYSGRKVADWASPGEYYDQTDVMSAANCWNTGQVATDPFSGAGPNLNMMWRDQWGWLLPGAIRRIATSELESAFEQALTLGARNYGTGQGLMCVQFLDIYVELATNTPGPTNFDAGLPSSGVLIHQRVVTASKTVPYVLVKNLATDQDQKFWFAGDVCTREGEGALAGTAITIWVKSVDIASGTSDIEISNQYPPPLVDARIVAIRKNSVSGGHGLEYIEFVGVPDASGAIRAVRRDIAIGWIQSGRNRFHVVGNDGSRAAIEVESHWLRTVPDGDKADNLLSLPSF